MADAKNNDEPSIEEILSSIRDIISEDDEKEQMPFDQKPLKTPEPEPMAVLDDDDIIDLTEIVEDEVAQVVSFSEEMSSVETEPKIEKNNPLAGIDLDHPDEDDLEIDEDNGLNDILGIDDSELSQDTESDMTMAENVSIDDLDAMFANDGATTTDSTVDLNMVEDEPLVDKIAETASVMAFAKLAENIAVSRHAAGTTLEDIVRDLMRPMLKDWLDDNLPILIERIVTKELERLAEKAVRK